MRAPSFFTTLLFICACCACCASCSMAEGPKGVAVTLQFDSSVDDAALASIASLTVDTTGDESYQRVIALNRPLNRVERFVYVPSAASRSVDISFTAVSGALANVARADTGVISVAPTKSVEVDVIMRAVAKEGDDGGVPADLSVIDLAPGDLAKPVDYKTLVLSDQPLAYYRLNEAAGTTAKDSSINGLNGGYFGGVSLGVPGALGRDPDTAISEAGMAAGVSAASTLFDLTGTKPFTLELWCKLTAPVAGKLLFMLNNDFYEPTNGRQDYNLFVDDNKIVHFERWVNGGIIAIGSAPLTVGKYTHIVAVFDGAQDILYVDGLLTSTNPDVRPGLAQGAHLSVGAADSTGGSPFNGSLDEVAVYTTALTSAQVAAHYTSGVAK